MIRTRRFTLSDTPQQVDTTNDDDLPNRALTIVVQTAGTVVVCEDTNSYSTGARIPVIAGQTISFDALTAKEKVWLASPDDVEVDTIESGVS